MSAWYFDILDENSYENDILYGMNLDSVIVSYRPDLALTELLITDNDIYSMLVPAYPVVLSRFKVFYSLYQLLQL